jgi:hypothetical protein
MKFSLEQYLCPKLDNCMSPGNIGSTGRFVPRKGSLVGKYISSTAVKEICSPHTIKQCRSGIHIQIRSYRRYS